jgi:hypothetical protein
VVVREDVNRLRGVAGRHRVRGVAGARRQSAVERGAAGIVRAQAV